MSIVARVAAVFLLAFSISSAECLAQEGSPGVGGVDVYIGTYTKPEKSKGIYLFSLDASSGKLTSKGLAGEVASPSFLAVHPSRRYLYAAGEVDTFKGKKSGAVSAFSIGQDGRLALLNQQPSGGSGPCFVAIDKTGRNALVANYNAGSVACLPIEADGKLKEPTSIVQHEGSSVNPQRQKEPHAHSINLSPDNRFALAADLGTDQILIYRLDAEKGTLTAAGAARVPPGSGPRHFAFHPNGKFAYAINEMASTVTAFAWDGEKGELTPPIETTTTLPAGFVGTTYCAEVQVHPSGKFLYGSNRGHDSITVFTIDQETGRITAVETESTRGKWPRNFGIDPSGRWMIVANQNSDSLSVFKIDQASGKLDPVGETVECFSPVCVKFLPR
jgi:6-phosphogluconolactonase